MTRIKLPGGSYTSQSVNADCQSTVNWYPERVESGDGNSDLVLYPTPGLRSFSDLTPEPVPPEPPPVIETGIQNVRISVSAAQIVTTGTTPLELIPAQGPDLLIVPLSVVVQYTFVSTAYSGGNRIFPQLGMGTTVADIQSSFNVSLSTHSFSDAFDTISQAPGAPSWNNLPPASLVNNPFCWVDQFDQSGNAGDGGVVLNIQFYVLNVATGAIVNGTGKVHGAKVELSAAQLSTANVTPLELVAAPGANKAIVPMSMVGWHHFNGTASTLAPLPKIGYGTVAADVDATQIFQFIDTNGFKLTADSMEQETPDYYPLSVPDIIPAQVINQPLTWVNEGTINGDTTITVYMQYMVIDLSTGEYVQGTGTLFNSLAQLTSAQIKAAFTADLPIVGAPGANKLIVEQYGVCQSNFVSAGYPNGITQPSPRVAPAATPANAVLRGLLRFSTTGGGITLWNNTVDQMLMERTTFYAAATSIPGAEILPAAVINQPSLWGDFHDASASIGDGTATLNLQYLVLDTTDGSLS